MGILSKILGSDTVIKTAGNALDDAFLTAQEKAQMSAQELSELRNMQMGSFASKLIQFYSMTEFKPLRFMLVLLLMFDFLVDATARAVRPWITVHLFGGIFGYWTLPQLGGIDPEVMSWFWIVLTFWFGARTLSKDLPALIKAFRKLRK